MPISFQVDNPRRLILTQAQGHLNFAEALGHCRELQAHAQFSPFFSELVDLREVTAMSITASEISQLAMVRVFDPAARRAFVGRSALIFGLCRMFAAYCAFNGQHKIGVFHEMEEARRWLGLADDRGEGPLQIAS